MKQTARYILVLILLAGIVFLAKNNLAGASGPMRGANQSALAKFQGFVWNDVNRDGVQDVGEAGLSNVTVDLYDNAKAIVNTVLTDATGHYQFGDLTPGDYYVHFGAPTGFVISPKDQGNDDALDSDIDSTTGETVLTKLVAGDNLLKWDAGMYTLAALPAQAQPGTVKPPPAEVTVCEDGVASVGGVSILEVKNLASDYCLSAFLRNQGFALGRLPDGAGKVLAPITFLRVFHQGTLIHDLPTQDGEVQICYAVPAGKQVQIYFFDFYGPRFGGGSGQPSWQPLETTVANGIACATAQTSGAYALIGK